MSLPTAAAFLLLLPLNFDGKLAWYYRACRGQSVVWLISGSFFPIVTKGCFSNCAVPLIS